MQNDDILTILSVMYNVARDLDQKGQGAASICTSNISSEDLVKYNILNILSYLCSCSNENDLNIDVISDIIGVPVTYSDCVDAAVANNVDNSILSYLPLSLVIMVNADKNNGVSLLENGSEEKSSAYTLFLIYQLIFTRFYKNCTVDELKVKNEPLYNFLLGISGYIYDNLKSMTSHYNPESGTVDAPNYRIDPRTGEIMINPPSRSNNSRRSRSTTRLPPIPTNAIPSSADAAPLPSQSVVIDVPLPSERNKPSLFVRFSNFFKRIFGRR